MLRQEIDQAVQLIIDQVNAPMVVELMSQKTCLKLIEEAKVHLAASNDIKSFEHYAALKEILKKNWFDIDTHPIEQAEEETKMRAAQLESLIPYYNQVLGATIKKCLSSNGVWQIATTNYGDSFGGILGSVAAVVHEKFHWFRNFSNVTPSLSLIFHGCKLVDFRSPYKNEQAAKDLMDRFNAAIAPVYVHTSSSFWDRPRQAENSQREENEEAQSVAAEAAKIESPKP